MSKSFKKTNLVGSIIVLVFSSAIQFLAFAEWPGNPDFDVHHSVFAAENFVTTGKILSINLFPDESDDLAKHAKLTWMTNWPPMQSVLYAAAMKAGLSAGGSTKALALLSVIIGGFGWIWFSRVLGAPTPCLITVAAAYPWLSFLARIYLDYKNDHLACAVVPWIYSAIIQIHPLITRPSENLSKLIFAALLTGFSVIIKYSMVPFVVSSTLYLLWLDGVEYSYQRIRRLGFLGFILLPGGALWIVNHILGVPSYPMQPGTGLYVSPQVYFAHLVTNTFGSAVGWDFVLIQINIFLEKLFGIGIFKGALLVASLTLLSLWILNLRQTPLGEKQQRLLAFLCISTITLWSMLVIMTVKSGVRFDYTSDMRFFIPIGLGWLALCIVSLFSSPRRDAIWVAALSSAVLPLIFSFAFFFLRGVTGAPYAAMPRSQTAWIGLEPDQNGQPGRRARQDPNHAAFLANLVIQRGRTPDLFVATEGRFLTELGVPCFYSFRATRNDGHIYYSTRTLEVWAMVEPDREATLMSKFSKASARERINVPEGFPYVVYIFKYTAENGNPSQ